MMTIIVARSLNHVIGNNGDLPWHQRADLQRFKELTLDRTVIMGRKTFESILARNGKPLPRRTSIVLSSQRDLPVMPGVVYFRSVEDIITIFSSLGTDAFVLGGEQLYHVLLPHCAKVFETTIDATMDGDAFFPEIGEPEWVAQPSTGWLSASEYDTYRYRYTTWRRVND